MLTRRDSASRDFAPGIARRKGRQSEREPGKNRHAAIKTGAAAVLWWRSRYADQRTENDAHSSAAHTSIGWCKPKS